MKLTKISLLAALIAGVMLVGTPALHAQDKDGKDGKKGKGPDLKERIAKMDEELKLTAEQKPKVEAAMKAMGEKMRALREDSSLSQDEKMAKGKAAREEMTKTMKGILTSEQFEKFEKMGPPGGKKGPGKKKDGN